MMLLMDNRSIKRSVGILHDVLVKMDKFILHTYFLILDYDVDTDIPIILSCLFIVTKRVIMDIKSGDLKFRANDQKVVFNIYKTLKLGEILKCCQ